MCGVFGLVLPNKMLVSKRDLLCDVREMIRISMQRGQDASGIAVKTSSGVDVLRIAHHPSNLTDDRRLDEIINNAYSRDTNGPVSIIGQCRLVTNGSISVEDNNQPIDTTYVTGVHNGITWDNTSTDNAPSITREEAMVQSDSRQLYERLSALFQESDAEVDLEKVLNQINGTASLAFFSNQFPLLYLYTNFGSLYYFHCSKTNMLIFFSEKYFVESFIKKSLVVDKFGPNEVNVQKLPLKNCKVFNTNSPVCEKSELKLPIKRTNVLLNHKSLKQLKRCSRCVLPETYPFILFDEHGVCNYCIQYEKQVPFGEEALEKELSKYRSKNGAPDCLVGLSGGRDSCYGLHLLKKKFNMNPVAYTYDWGLTTDLARVNQARMLSKLQVEHILRAPDISKKRRNIRENVHAWVSRPHLGMVPLFMAGDKDFYHLGRKLKQETGLKLTIFCAGQQVEQREFFVGFCGVNQRLKNNTRLYEFPLFSKIRLAFYYASQYALNPKYINHSLIDSVRSFFTTFLGKDDFLYLFQYVPWHEPTIDEVLKNEYGWEQDKSYGKNQWRMGDGQTSFTNYIYHTIAGFSEFDNFRSNQIREGFLTRQEALKLIEEDNKPKFESLKYFGHVVGINIEEVLRDINKVPKLY